MHDSIEDYTRFMNDLAALGRISKRRKDLVIFAGRGKGRLIDNVKYLFLHAATRDVGFESWFFTTHKDEKRLLADAGLPVMDLESQNVKLLTQASLLVMDDQPVHIPEAYLLCGGAKKLQLWHGIPLKKIGFPEIESNVNMTPDKIESLTAGYSGAENVLSTSPWVTAELFSKVFRAENFLDLGYPRNDVLLRPLAKPDLLNADKEIYSVLRQHRKGGGRVAVYMPTFRDTQGDFIDAAGRFVLDPPALAEFTARHNLIILMKLHPYIDDRALSAIPGILRYPSSQDIYPLLPLADMLITDYSSVYFDYLLLDRPILFFAYDEERYVKADRELFFAYRDFTPGPVSATQPELLARLAETIARLTAGGVDSYAAARRELRDKLFAYHDGGASARICEYIKSTLLE